MTWSGADSQPLTHSGLSWGALPGLIEVGNGVEAFHRVEPLRADKFCPVKVGLSETGASQISAREICFRQVRVREIGLAQIRDGSLEHGRANMELAVGLDSSNALLRTYLERAGYVALWVRSGEEALARWPVELRLQYLWPRQNLPRSLLLKHAGKQARRSLRQFAR